MNNKVFRGLAAVFAVSLLAVVPAATENLIRPGGPTNFFAKRGFFNGLAARGAIGQVVNVDPQPGEKQEAPKLDPESSVQPSAKDRPQLTYRTDNPSENDILPPDQTPSVRVEADAPGCVKAMILASRSGDNETAKAYAAQCVRMQQNYFFEVQQMTQLWLEALVDQKVLQDGEDVGVNQMINYELARTREEMKAILRPTHDVAMQRIQADPKAEVEVFYFFTLNCSWCRYMAPEVERLWRYAKSTPNVKMTALTLGPTPEDWIEEYRNYTGLTVPIFEGEELAKEFKIGFVPAVVVVTPNTKRAYLKTGQQSFARMYEFVRTAQGLPVEVTEELLKIAQTPVGELERQNDRRVNVASKATAEGPIVRVKVPQKARDELQKF